MRYLVASVVFLGLLVSVSSAAMRTWTSSNGKYTVRAELVDFDAQSVRLKKDDGTVLTVPLDKLSEADQRYVKRQATRTGQANSSQAESDDAEGGKTESSRSRSSSSRSRAKQEEEIAVPGEAQSLELKLNRLELPRTPAGGPADLAYRVTRPQHFYLPVNEGGTPQFSQVIHQEPEYASSKPVRGVAILASQPYGFALDAKAPGKPGYGRLYFDVNRNGDLTDDGHKDAYPMPGSRGGTSAQYRFPRVDLTLEAGGAEYDYSFLFSAVYVKSKDDEYVSASLNAGAYREAELRASRKKKHRLVLVDFNSNGRFDDPFRVEDRGAGDVAPVPGDLLLVDPGPASTLDFELTAGDNRFFVSKLINLGGQFFELEVSPAGDQVELKPSSVEVGYVSSQHPGFRAILYNDDTFLKIGGEKTKGIPLPVGDWKLLTYSVHLSGGMPGRGGPTLVAARGTDDCKTLEIVKGKTVDLPFGPPFKAHVRASGRRGNEVRLALSIVGAGGEVCTNLLINGSRPESPEFIITTPKGEVVERGKFKFG